VLALAGQAGLSDDRAGDVVLAVHELAANVICHGGGKGRLQAWQLTRALLCQVDDGDLIASADPAASLDPFPELPGHGLWVARRVADQMQALSGPRGTRVTLIFELPAAE
jgi:anti-sigma regulatory factor (Ser/Thr protein kinase)